MKYILMCGGNYGSIPKHLTKINGEELIARTIRLLRAEGVEDIAISTHYPVFEKFGLPIFEHDNSFNALLGSGYWIDAFYPMEEPACYVFGDVFFSPEAIHTIVTTETDSVEFFASAPPYAPEYPKPWAEPFAFKVTDQKHFRDSIRQTKFLCDTAQFKRHPLAWELWQVIKGTPINHIDYTNYTVINDYTCDIDDDTQIDQWRNKL